MMADNLEVYRTTRDALWIAYDETCKLLKHRKTGVKALARKAARYKQLHDKIDEWLKAREK